MFSVVGRGAYPIGQAVRLLRVNPDVQRLVGTAAIRRWAYGYKRAGRMYDAAIHTEPFSQETDSLSFLELVEIMFIVSSLAVGTKWSKVRAAVQTATRLLPQERHPLAHRRWFADPVGLYLPLGWESGENVLVEMAGDAQLEMEGVLRRYLRQIRFDEYTGLANTWHPLGLEVPVLVDPKRSFGQPIVESSVRTDVLAGHHKAGDDAQAISAWYDVPQHEVEAAIDFEEQLEQAAA